MYLKISQKRNFKNGESFFWRFAREAGFRPACEMRHQTLGPRTTSSGGDILHSALVVYKKRAGSASAMVQIFSGTVCKKWLFLLYLFVQGTATQKAAHPLLFFYGEERCSASLVYTKERWCRDDYIQRINGNNPNYRKHHYVVLRHLWTKKMSRPLFALVNGFCNKNIH